VKEGWARSRWYEFRVGHGIYLIFILTFVNFILISYRLLIERIPFLEGIVPELWVFMVLFLAFYVPAAIIIGFWHRKTQLKVESTLVQQQNPMLAKLFRTMLDVKTGKASKEEIEKFRKFFVRY